MCESVRRTPTRKLQRRAMEAGDARWEDEELATFYQRYLTHGYVAWHREQPIPSLLAWFLSLVHAIQPALKKACGGVVWNATCDSQCIALARTDSADNNRSVQYIEME